MFGMRCADDEKGVKTHTLQQKQQDRQFTKYSTPTNTLNVYRILV
jgi:hypothetical protein